MSYKSYVTNLGAAKIASAAAIGTKVDITKMAIGDGGGSAITPAPDMTALVNEVARINITATERDEAANTLTAIAAIAADVGGWTIRELGLYDSAGDLIAVCNYPDTIKPVLTDGVASSVSVGMVIVVSSLAAVTITVSASVDLRPYEADTTNIKMDGVVSVGTRNTVVRGDHRHPTDTSRAPVASPAFTGTPTAPTPADSTNNTQIATTEFVKRLLSALVDTSPASLDTLRELATALNNDPDFATTVFNALATKLNISDFTAAAVLAKLLTVDGSGSGLDADLLDGKHLGFGANQVPYVGSDGALTLQGMVNAVNGQNVTKLDNVGEGAGDGAFLQLLTPGKHRLFQQGSSYFKIMRYNGSSWLTDLAIDANGNMALGGPPSNWGNGCMGMQFPSGNGIATTGDGSMLTLNNCYYDGSVWRFLNTGRASVLALNRDGRMFFSSSTDAGTAGSVANFLACVEFGTTGTASFAGAVSTPTPAVSDDSTKVATTSWVKNAMSTIMSALGFAASFGSAGYVKFPSCLGSVLIQWGTLAVGTNTTATGTFPIAFPTACYRMVGSPEGVNNASVYGNAVAIAFLNNTQYVGQTSEEATQINWIALGR